MARRETLNDRRQTTDGRPTLWGPKSSGELKITERKKTTKRRVENRKRENMNTWTQCNTGVYRLGTVGWTTTKYLFSSPELGELLESPGVRLSFVVNNLIKQLPLHNRLASLDESLNHSTLPKLLKELFSIQHSGYHANLKAENISTLKRSSCLKPLSLELRFLACGSVQWSSSRIVQIILLELKEGLPEGLIVLHRHL